MANVLTALLPVLYASARRVPQELTGFIGAGMKNFDDKMVAQGGTVKVPTVPKGAVGSIPSPAMTWVAGTDRTPATIDLTLSQTAEYKWNLTGEEERALLNSGTAQETLRQTMENGWRAIRNAVEAYLGTVAKNNCSRAVGTAGTTPFASNTSALVDARKILQDNGSTSPRSLIIDTAAEANLLKLDVLQHFEKAGDTLALRAGSVGRLHGCEIAPSAGVATHTKGTATGALVNSAVLAVGDTVITFDGATAGATGIKAGDVIAIAGDSNKYVVKTGLVAASGTITIQEPGLLTAVADNSAITIENTSTDNILMGESGLVSVVRPILQPSAADIEQLVVSDAVSGLSCLLIRKVGDQMASWYMRSVYDAFSPNPYELVKLRG